jgi:hypothetical protein
VPVFKSSLLQVTPAQQTIGPERVVGILGANSKYIGERHMSAVGIRPVSNYVIGERSQRPIKLACPIFCLNLRDST